MATVSWRKKVDEYCSCLIAETRQIFNDNRQSCKRATFPWNFLFHYLLYASYHKKVYIYVLSLLHLIEDCLMLIIFRRVLASGGVYLPTKLPTTFPKVPIIYAIVVNFSKSCVVINSCSTAYRTTIFPFMYFYHKYIALLSFTDCIIAVYFM